jgi:hypothetical protein
VLAEAHTGVDTIMEMGRDVRLDLLADHGRMSDPTVMSPIV